VQGKHSNVKQISVIVVICFVKKMHDRCLKSCFRTHNSLIKTDRFLQTLLPNDSQAAKKNPPVACWLSQSSTLLLWLLCD
jgi:hypothetical protein